VEAQFPHRDKPAVIKRNVPTPIHRTTVVDLSRYSAQLLLVFDTKQLISSVYGHSSSSKISDSDRSTAKNIHGRMNARKQLVKRNDTRKQQYFKSFGE